MNTKLLKDFISLNKDGIKNKLKNCSNEEIMQIADAYFLGKDGKKEYNRDYYIKCYGSIDKIRQKLQGVAYPTLVCMIERALNKE